MKSIVILFAAAIGLIDAIDPSCPYPSSELTFLPNRQDCTKFFECYQGTKSELSCPPNLYWNQTAKACDYRCDFGDNSTPQPGPTPAPTIAPVPTRNPMCPFPSEVITFFPDREDCTKFYECYEGKRSIYSCPPNTFWNQRAKVCDYVCDFGDDSTPVPQPTGPTAAPTREPEPTRNPMCPYPSEVITYFPDKEDCTKFYECYEGKRSINRCPANTFWNQKMKVCDKVCDFDDGSTHQPPAPTAAPTIAPVPTRNPMCPYPSEVITFFPNRADCTKFFECYQGKRSEFTCPPHTFWNQRAKVCDYVCDFGNDTTPVPVPPTPSPAPLPDDICKGKSDGAFLPDPTNCRRFIECSHEKSNIVTCAAGTIWDQSVLTCIIGSC